MGSSPEQSVLHTDGEEEKKQRERGTVRKLYNSAS